MPNIAEWEKIAQMLNSGERIATPAQKALIDAKIAERTAAKAAAKRMAPTVATSLNAGDLAREANNTVPGEKVLQKLTTPDDFKAKMDMISNRGKKVAGVAGAVGAGALGSLGGNNDASASEMPSVPMGGEMGAREAQPTQPQTPGPSMLDKLGSYYNQLPEGLKNNISAGSEMLSVPSASLRNAAYAAQTGKPIGEAMYQGAVNPDQAKTGADIADATGIDDTHPYIKAALATASDMADPTDLAMMGEGKFSKLAGMMKGK